MPRPVWRNLQSIKLQVTVIEPHIYVGEQHPIKPQDISLASAEIVKVLENEGYSAYVVGGCVRDLLLGLDPKDFDVATDATPEQIKRLFRRARIIGRRFQIVHVRSGREVVEITTFRAHHPANAKHTQGLELSSRSKQGLLLRDNVFGSIIEDAKRRDFTINALYYHPADNTLYDYSDGLTDIGTKTLRMIGDPAIRYREDPVRMLRAARFCARLGFNLATDTAASIPPAAHLLSAIPSARLYDETLKLFMSGYALQTWLHLRDLQLDTQLFPESAPLIDRSEYYRRFITAALTNTDLRIASGKHVTPAFLFAALLWPAVCEAKIKLKEKGEQSASALQTASAAVTGRQVSRIAIPKRFTLPMREIWELQPRLSRRSGQQAFRLLDRPRFRAAYDFLLLREQSGEDTNGLGDWWTRFQDANDEEREIMVDSQSGRKRPAKKRRSRGQRSDQIAD